jgi:hypothetical protein
MRRAAMKDSTLTRKVTGTGAARPVEAFATLWPAFLSLARQKRQLGKKTEKPARVAYADDTMPPQADSYVMLVESDIREGVRGILP